MRRSANFMALAFAAALVPLFAATADPVGGAGVNMTERAPRINYALNCQGCHLPDGRGMAGRVPDMRGLLGKLAALPAGRAYIVQVPGTANSKLNDAQTAALLNWLVPAMGPKIPGGFKPYSAAEVGTLRAGRLKQIEPLRSQLIRTADQLPPP